MTYNKMKPVENRKEVKDAMYGKKFLLHSVRSVEPLNQFLRTERDDLKSVMAKDVFAVSNIKTLQIVSNSDTRYFGVAF